MITAYNSDCLEAMRSMKDNEFDWGCIDPPYGLGKRLSDGGGKLKDTPMAKLYRSKDWDVLPDEEFWIEFFRVTKNQIVFGANYFIEYLKNTRGFVCWDKKNDLTTMSACELVWTSLDKPAKIMKKSSQDLNRFHPTQKPVYAYEFMFKYCKIQEGEKILDSFGGSFSSAIACHNLGFDLTIFEIDKDYFDAGMKRLAQHQQQLTMF